MDRRSLARAIAVQMLYQIDLNPEADLRQVRSLVDETQLEDILPEEDLRDVQLDDELRNLAWRLFVGVRENRPLIDAKIQAVAENWSLKRMAPTDRNVLRLGTYELLNTDTPHRVALDEAIELARVFGSAHSAQFVNGILDKLVPAEKRSGERRPSG